MKKIVLIDDDAVILSGLETFIRSMNLPLLVTGMFTNSQKALEFIEKEGADVVLADIRMPPLDGIQVAKILYEKYPETLVILLTAYREELTKGTNSCKSEFVLF